MKNGIVRLTALIVVCMLLVSIPAMAAKQRVVFAQPYHYEISTTEPDSDEMNKRVMEGMFGGTAAGTFVGFMYGGPAGAVAGAVLGMNGGGAIGSVCGTEVKREYVYSIHGYKIVLESGKIVLTRERHKVGEYVDLDSMQKDYLMYSN